MDQCLYLNCQDNSKVIHTSYMLSGVSWNFNCFFYCVRCEHLIHDDIGNNGDVGEERKNCNGKRVWRANPPVHSGPVVSNVETFSTFWTHVQRYSLQCSIATIQIQIQIRVQIQIQIHIQIQIQIERHSQKFC